MVCFVHYLCRLTHMVDPTCHVNMFKPLIWDPKKIFNHAKSIQQTKDDYTRAKSTRNLMQLSKHLVWNKMNILNETK